MRDGWQAPAYLVMFGSFGIFSGHKDKPMPHSQTDFLKISDAAKFLGVAPNTLRSWSETGKVQEYRHPINNYRLYKVADLEELNACLRQPIRVELKPAKKRTRKPK
jgi:hypothetical protein